MDTADNVENINISWDTIASWIKDNRGYIILGGISAITLYATYKSGLNKGYLVGAKAGWNIGTTNTLATIKNSAPEAWKILVDNNTIFGTIN
jgi:hypothetical protein